MGEGGLASSIDIDGGGWLSGLQSVRVRVAVPSLLSLAQPFDGIFEVAMV
jgi:hypothetical protein